MEEKINFDNIKKKMFILIISDFILMFLLMWKGRTFASPILLLVSFLIITSIICCCYYMRSFTIFLNPNKTNIFFQIIDILSMLALACVIFQSFFTFCYFRATVDGSSMYQTLENEDVLIVRSTNKVTNFDIVVVRLEEERNVLIPGVEDGDLLVKRVIGVPGDTFYFEDDILYLNNEAIDETYLKDSNGNFKYAGSMNDFTLASRCWINGENACEDVNECVIPEDYYFVMGDNRTNSSDSRLFGLFHKSQIRGVVKYRVNSLFDWENLTK